MDWEIEAVEEIYATTRDKDGKIVDRTAYTVEYKGRRLCDYDRRSWPSLIEWIMADLAMRGYEPLRPASQWIWFPSRVLIRIKD